MPTCCVRRQLGRKKHGDQFRTYFPCAPGHCPRQVKARADWAITVDFAQRLGVACAATRTTACSPSGMLGAALEASTSCGRDRDLADLSGIDHAALDQIGPQRRRISWARRAGEHRACTPMGCFPTDNGPRTLYRRSLSSSQRTPGNALPDPDHRTPARPMAWQTAPAPPRNCSATSVRRSSACPDELRRHRFQDGDLVNLKAVVATLIVAVSSDDGVRPDDLPAHALGRSFSQGRRQWPRSSQHSIRYPNSPELKHSGVRLEAVQRCRGLIVCTDRKRCSATLTLRPLCEGFAYIEALGLASQRAASVAGTRGAYRA